MNYPSAMKRKDLPNKNSGSGLLLGDWLKNALIELKSLPDEPVSSIYALVSFVLKKPNHFGISHPEYSLDENQLTFLESLLTRLLDGEPLPYLTGKQEFFGLEFIISKRVVIPRPETELLVSLALNWLRNRPPPVLAADVGTGSGCIAISICSHLPAPQFIATDISFDALQTSAQNLEKHKLKKRIQLVQTYLLEGLAGKLDCICANLPYIPSGRLPNLQVSKYEPISALDGGHDGLYFIKKLLEQSHSRISTNGVIFLEIDFSQEKEISNLAKSFFPAASIKIRNDLADLPRIVIIETGK